MCGDLIHFVFFLFVGDPTFGLRGSWMIRPFLSLPIFFTIANAAVTGNPVKEGILFLGFSLVLIYPTLRFIVALKIRKQTSRIRRIVRLVMIHNILEMLLRVNSHSWRGAACSFPPLIWIATSTIKKKEIPT